MLLASRRHACHAAVAVALRLALAALSGVLYFVSFVGFDQFYLTWICFVPVLWATRDVTPRRALLLGAVFGLVTHMGGYYWVVHLLQEFAYLALPLAVLGYMLLCAYQGFSLAIIVWLVRRAGRDLKVAPVVALPVALAFVEPFYPFLFPSYIGNAQYLFVPIIQVVEVFGMLGLGVLIGLVNAAFFELLSAKREGRPVVRRRLIGPAVAFVSSLAFGLIRIPMIEAQMEAAPKLKVAMVQTNLGARDKKDRAAEFIRRHVAMSQDVQREHPDLDLIVWPESAYNRALPKNIENVKEVVTPGIDKPVVFGALTYQKKTAAEMKQAPKGSRNYHAFNTAVMTSSTGDVLGMFDKVVLLYFGETIPLVETFPQILKWFPRSSVFKRGTTWEHFALPEPKTKFMPMICYEDIIPTFVRDFWHRAGPPDALINVTNDSWYGDTNEPLIHLVLASFRSVETRRALIRSTNTGISAFVDPVGRITQRTGQWTQETLVGEVPMITDGGSTPYILIGDLLGWLALALVVWGFVAARRRRSVK